MTRSLRSEIRFRPFPCQVIVYVQNMFKIELRVGSATRRVNPKQPKNSINLFVAEFLFRDSERKDSEICHKNRAAHLAQSTRDGRSWPRPESIPSSNCQQQGCAFTG